MAKRPQALACPACKRKANLVVGAVSFSTMGVECCACHLVVYESIPDKWPLDATEELRGLAASGWLHQHTLQKAVERWNRLPRTK